MKRAGDKIPPPKSTGKGRQNEKKELAQLLFTRNDLSRKEIADRISVNEKTVGKWVKDGHWEDMRKSLLTTKDQQLRNLLDQLSELNAAIDVRPKGQRYPDPKEANTQGQITASIKKLTTDAGLNEIMEICPKILGFTLKNFPEHLKTITNILDIFVQQYLR